jgi:hypothetical protein
VIVVARLFFPQSRALHLDLSQDSPELQRLLSKLGSSQTSYEQSRLVLWDTLRLEIDPKRIERVTHRVGEDRLAEVDALNARFAALPLAEKEAAPPGLALVPDVVAVEVDGGRYQQRSDAETVTPPGLPPESRPTPRETVAPDVLESHVEEVDKEAKKRSTHWREDKIGVLLTLSSSVHEEDPCPHVPQCFLDVGYAQKLATEIKNARVPEPGEPFHTPQLNPEGQEMPPPAGYEAPQVLTRQVLATPENSTQFGLQVAAQAWGAGFFASGRKAFLGDGEGYNWTIWKERFPTFTPILDFVHLLTYVFTAAFAGRTRASGTAAYQEWIELAWSGKTEELIAAMRERQMDLGLPQKDDPETSPRRTLAKALGYIEANQSRMQYAAYRKTGLPINTCLVESTVKQMNFRIKGTEKFWSKKGGRAVLQLRADSLSDVRTLDDFFHRREAAATGQRRYTPRKSMTSSA